MGAEQSEYYLLGCLSLLMFVLLNEGVLDAFPFLDFIPAGGPALQARPLLSYFAWQARKHRLCL